MTKALCALIFVVLSFHAPAALAAAGPLSDVASNVQPATAPSFTPEAPPEACRACGGMPYFSPSATPSEDAVQPEVSSGAADPPRKAVSDDRPKGTSGAPARLEREGSHLSSDRRINAARALIQRNRFAEALNILKPLATGDHPNQTDVRFLLGLAASRGSQSSGVGDDERLALLNLAIAALRSILIHEPGLVRVRLELARAFFLKEADDLARDHFERVLAGRPPAPVIANVSRFLNVMRARRRWRGYFGFSIAPDTNINAASDAQFIYINGLPFRRSTATQASSDIGVVGWGGAEYQYPLADRWRLRAGFDLNHREYKGGRFDQTFVAGHVGPRWLISRNTEMSLLASVSQRWWGGSPFNYDVGARFEVEHRVFPGLRASGRASWQDRKYQQNPGLEGPLMVFSLGANYVLFPTVQVNGLVGYLQQDAKFRRWDSAGYWTRLGTNVALPWGFTVGVSSEFRWTNYESGWYPFLADNNSARSDQTRILQATLLNRALTVYGFSPQILYSNELRESNAQVFDFKRNRIEMRFIRQF